MAHSERSTRAGTALPVRSRCSTALTVPNEVVRIEGDYRPCQIGSVDVVAADMADPRGGPLTPLSNVIGVGRADWVRSPLPPNRACGSPASGSLFDGVTCKRTGIGRMQAEKPMFGKEGVGPLDLVNQALLFAAFDPRLEGRQHPRCPHPGSTHDHSWCGAVTSQVSPPRIALSGTATGCVRW